MALCRAQLHRISIWVGTTGPRTKTYLGTLGKGRIPEQHSARPTNSSTKRMTAL